MNSLTVSVSHRVSSCSGLHRDPGTWSWERRPNVMIRVVTLEQLRVKEGSTGARTGVASAVTRGQCEGRPRGRRSGRALSGENVDRHPWAQRPGRAGKGWAL